MAEIKILIEGYAKKLSNGWIASSTVCLVTTSEGKKIITDPGCNREKLSGELASHNINTSDIDFVFLSHCHPDHTLLSSIFENAKFVTFDSNLVYENDSLTDFDKHIMGMDTEVIDTPGHVIEHISLLVNTPKGKIAIAGDAIFWTQDQEQIFDINQEDPSQAKGMDMAKLIESRKKLIQMADYIIPGHGKIFKIEK